MRRLILNAPASMWRDPVQWVAFGFGAGALPRAPGTFGTLVAVPIYLLVSGWPLWFYVGVTALAFLGGIWICDRTARALGVHDHSGIVWDEIVGFLVCMTAAPAGWGWILGGFAAFRLFDIWKPWPIRWLDGHVRGGWGIMLDDLAAGLYGMAVLQLAAWWLL